MLEEAEWQYHPTWRRRGRLQIRVAHPEPSMRIVDQERERAQNVVAQHQIHLEGCTAEIEGQRVEIAQF